MYIRTYEVKVNSGSSSRVDGCNCVVRVLSEDVVLRVFCSISMLRLLADLYYGTVCLTLELQRVTFSAVHFSFVKQGCFYIITHSVAK